MYVFLFNGQFCKYAAKYSCCVLNVCVLLCFRKCTYSCLTASSVSMLLNICACVYNKIVVSVSRHPLKQRGFQIMVPYVSCIWLHIIF